MERNQASKILLISENLVKSIENGENLNLSITQIESIAKFCKMPIDELIFCKSHEEKIISNSLTPKLYLDEDENELLSYYNLIKSKVTKWQIIGIVKEKYQLENLLRTNVIFVDFIKKRRM